MARGIGGARRDPQVVATDPKLHNKTIEPNDLKRVYAFRHIEDSA